MRKRGGQSWWPWEPGIRQLPIFGSSTSLSLLIWPISYLVERGGTWINILSFVFSIVEINGRGRQRSFLRKRWISCPFKTHLHPRGRFLFLHWSKFLFTLSSSLLLAYMYVCVHICNVLLLPHHMRVIIMCGAILPVPLLTKNANNKHCLKAMDNSLATFCKCLFSRQK